MGVCFVDYQLKIWNPQTEPLPNSLPPQVPGVPSGRCSHSSTPMAAAVDDVVGAHRDLGELAYEALRLAFMPWQRERRLAKERERTRIARLSSRLICASADHSLAIRSDGSVACWGQNDWGLAPPDDIDGDFVATAAGDYHSIALRRDGGITCWGNNDFNQAPPAGVVGDFFAIAAGWRHSIALRRDGSIACWGHNDDGQAPPGGVAGPFMLQDM